VDAGVLKIGQLGFANVTVLGDMVNHHSDGLRLARDQPQVDASRLVGFANVTRDGLAEGIQTTQVDAL